MRLPSIASTGALVDDQLLQQHAAEIQRFLWRLCGDFQIAEELSQDVLLKAHRNLEKLKEPAALRRWLFAIAVNAFNDWLRSKSKKQSGRVQSLEAQEIAGPEFDDPQRELVSRELASLLKEAMASLPRQQRSVLVLHGVEGFSHEEIAESLGMSYDSVKVNLFHARRRLRQLVEVHLQNEGRKA